MNHKNGNLVDQAVNAIIRPPRRTYDAERIPLYIESPDGAHQFTRHPVGFTNNRKQKLIGSIYLESNVEIMSGCPCIIYLHGNASSQREGQFLIPNFCPRGIAVFCFDFAGCGNSDGDYISLGYYENQDLTYLIDILHLSFNMGPFVLWGRSMGASTAVMCRHPLVKCKIVDSAYTSIPDVCKAIAVSMKLPSILCPAVLWVLKLSISEKANFDISTVSALQCAKMPDNVPILMCHAVDDEFVPYEEGFEIYRFYSNPDKYLFKAAHGHNGHRSTKWFKKATLFALKHFGIEIESPKKFQFIKYPFLHESSCHFNSYDDLVKCAKGRTTSANEGRGSQIALDEIDRPKYEISRIYNVIPITA